MRIALLLSALLLAGPALAAEDLAATFRDLERTVDFDDAHSVEAAEARLDAVRAHWWEQVLPPGDLRGALAASLTREEAVTLLEQAAREPELRHEREAALAENLASRGDVTGLLLERGVFERLAASHRKLLFDLAAVALVEGEAEPALVLLREPAITAKTAEPLAWMAWPEGLRLLADVLAGEHALPPEAWAQLGSAEPDVDNIHTVRSLGEARIAALVEVARTSPDPALRAVAARVLLRDATASAFDAAVEAYRISRTVFLDDEAWWRLARVHGRLITDRRVSRRGRILALRGILQFTGPDPSDYPQDAEASARDLRAWFATLADPLLRGLVMRELEDLRYHFVDADGRRKLAVPSYVALLDDLVEGRPEDPPALRALGRRVGLRLRIDLTREPAPHWRRDERQPRRRSVLPEALRDLDALGVTRCLAGLDGPPALRAQLADHAHRVFDTDDDARFGRARREGLALEAGTVAALARVLAQDGDPHLVELAGSILRLSPSPGAYEALLAHAARLWYAQVDRIPVPNLARHLGTRARLEATLAFVADAKQPPWIREAVAEQLLQLDWLMSFPGDAREATWTRLEAWIRKRAPMLDAGLPEIVLPLWAEVGTRIEAQDLGVPAATDVAATLRAAVSAVPAAGPRLRLRAVLLTGD